MHTYIYKHTQTYIYTLIHTHTDTHTQPSLHQICLLGALFHFVFSLPSTVKSSHHPPIAAQRIFLTSKLLRSSPEPVRGEGERFEQDHLPRYAPG